jgi:hypothetical protein
MIEPQQHYYSGHRHYHAIHSQVVIDNTGEIRHIECGFLGHQHDAQQFRLMRQIGQDLPFSQNCVLLGDKIYPNGHPVITPFTQAQIRRKPDRLQRKCRKFNRTLSEYRVLVEHLVGELKCYKVIGTVWRHPRTKLKRVAEICAGLVCRRRQLFY